MMDAKTLEYGLKALEGTDLIAEALIHPCKYSSKKLTVILKNLQ